MLNPIALLAKYQDFVVTLCTRTFEQHRELPCQVLKEATLNNTQPSCKKCKYEKEK